MIVKVTYNISNPFISVSNQNPVVYVKIAYGVGGSSTSTVWGTITGTLSDQVDLQSALDAKFDDPTGTTAQYIRGDGSLATFPSLTGYVPYTGATTNVDLGEYGLTSGQLTFDTSPTGTASVATTRWNNTIGSTETTLKGGEVVLKNGVDLVARIVNKVTPNTTLTKANYAAVRVSGAAGQRLAVAYAQANNDNNSADTIGLVCETIATNQEGFIICVGQLSEINTTGSLQGETWSDGDVLYLSPTTAGKLTNIKPTGATGHIVVIGYVEYAHSIHGSIYVKVMNGWELDELHNVSITSVANNDGLFYESSSSLWKNKSIATVLGYTPVPTTRTITINGTAYDLSADRSWTTTNGTVTSVAMTTPTGLTVSGSPITSSGTLALSMASGYAIPTTIKQSNWDDAYTWVSGFPTQSGNNGKYLTTDGSALSWGTISVNNIYNSNGSLTADRTITLAGFDLSFVGSTYSSKFSKVGRLLLGGPTESVYILDVKGLVRFSGDLLVSNNVVVGRGNNSQSFNTAFGTSALQSNDTSGNWNTGVGYQVLKANVSGNFNTAIGSNSVEVSLGSNNTGIGAFTFAYLTTGDNNIAIGSQAGYKISGGSSNLTASSNSIFIGYQAYPLADSQTNQIVIGHGSVGLGSNTTILGNSSTTLTSIPAGQLKFGSYTTSTSYTGTAAGYLAFTASGNIITVAVPTITSGTVTSVSVVSANGFAGTVANATTTPAITLTTSITGVLKGNGTAISAASAGTDYQAPISLTTNNATGVATFTSNTLNIPKYDTITTNRQTSSYSLVLTDSGKLIEMNVSTANTLTIPLNSSIAFPVGTKIDVTQYGAGATTITATGGVTIRSLSSYLKLGGQYAACTLVKIGTDEWYCYGNLIA